MKYTPTAEEKDSLNQVAEDEDVVAALARADRFMLDVSKCVILIALLHKFSPS